MVLIVGEREAYEVGANGMGTCFPLLFSFVAAFFKLGIRNVTGYNNDIN